MDMVRNNKWRSIVKNTAICILSFLFLIGCYNYSSEYGMSYNEIRKELGLPLLDSSWEISKNTTTFEIWVDRKFSSSNNYASYWKKEIGYNNSGLIYEVDYYSGASYYKTIDGTFRETLDVKYYYNPERSNDSLGDNWKCVLFDQESIDDGYFGKKISLSEADSILISWGISRLNY